MEWLGRWGRLGNSGLAVVRFRRRAVGSTNTETVCVFIWTRQSHGFVNDFFFWSFFVCLFAVFRGGVLHVKDPTAVKNNALRKDFRFH